MKAWVLAQKDLRVYFRDRLAVLLGFGLPIVLCTVFAGAMGAIGGGGDSVGRIELVIEDADRSAASRKLLAALGDSKGLRLDVLAPGSETSPSKETARGQVAEGDAPAGILIGAGFGAALESDGDLPLTLFRDPAKTIEQQILAGNLIPAFLGALGDSLGKRMSSKVLAALDFPLIGRASAQAILDSSWTSMESLLSDLDARGELDEEDEDGDGDASDGADHEDGTADDDGDAPSGNGGAFDFASSVAEILGIQVEDVTGGDEHAQAEKRGYQANSVAGMAVMMLLFGLIHCGGTLLDEQESGTLDRLRLVPGASAAILGGKFLFTWVVGAIQLAILFLYAHFVFDTPIFRSPLALVVLSTVTAAAVTGFGVLFAVVSRSRKQLEGLSTIVVLSMSALGGSWWPLAITPEWYQKLGHFTLNAWAMDGYQGIFWYGKGTAGILPELGVLTGIALGTSLLAWKLWERRMRV